MQVLTQEYFTEIKRQHYVGINPNLRLEQQRQQLIEKEKAFVELILRAYRGEAACS